MKGPEIDGGLEGLGDLAQRGSSAAADALADLIGCRILRCAPAFHPPEDFRGRLEWDSGVFCDVGGAFAGAAAVFLCSGGQSRVVEALCGSRAPSGEFAASALSEFGNMLTSRALSAIGDGVGALLLPGLPELANSGAGAFFQDRLGAGAENADTLCVESEPAKLEQRQQEAARLRSAEAERLRVAAAARERHQHLMATDKSYRQRQRAAQATPTPTQPAAQSWFSRLATRRACRR